MPLDVVAGAGISAGANLLSGAWALEAQERQNAIAQRQYKQQAKYQRKMDRKNIELQKDFAQQGIRWKVADAEAAGIHPLYALGATPMNFAPVSAGGPAATQRVAETGMANALAAAGQDVSRAIQSTRTASERDQAYANSARDLQLQNMGLQNEILAAQAAKLRSDQVGPPGPQLVPASEQYSAAPRIKFGVDVPHNPFFSNAEDDQKRYGDSELASTASFVKNFVADTVYNALMGARWLAPQIPSGRRAPYPSR